MKRFVVLAALLLVPTMAYFQTQWFESGLQGELQAEVEVVLADEGVEDALVRMEWRDATISGMVGSSVQREAVEEGVNALDGVRVARGGNRLEVRGWLKLVRKDGVLTVSGLLPKGESQFLRFIDDVKLEVEELQGEVSRAEWVAPPAGVMEWNEFVGVFFDGPGNRAADLRGGKLVIGGEATPELRTVWLAKAAGVVGEGQVEDVLTVRSSFREFEGYMPTGIEDAEAWGALRDVLAASVVEFAPESVEVSAAGREMVASVAAAIVDLGGEAVFLIEGSSVASDAEAVNRGVRRAEAVRQLLVEYGIGAEQLEVVASGEAGVKNPGHRVSISVK